MDRIWAKVDKTETCWLWTAGRSTDGYGRISVDGKTLNAHRVIYEMLGGVIPEGMCIDHLCRVRACVNPAHMEVVTPAENRRRGLAPTRAGSKNRAKTHCPHGHPYDEGNTYIQPSGGRVCRACRNAYGRAWFARKQLAAKS